ncbi:MAG TPA: glycosyltransferase family 4 protein, partial [Candidatus Wunengus sp. YC60]|uniref:glycosyltransferase family 4 protein n=1 Tax=Candidatus Wunengus sp. YC60 TaxID=3367697 RepID=UPI0040264955
KVLDIYDNVDVFISPSNFLKDKFLEMGFTKEIVHIPNFVDIEKIQIFFADHDIEYAEKDISIVYFGRLSPEKGLLTLIEAAKLLSNENDANTKSNIKIKIIGDGPMREELQEKVRIEGINNIEFLGYMKGESLFQEIIKSPAAILPSECYENNPISVLEAFALGKPVIGARIGGIPELVKNHETGLTFEPGNASDLAEKITYVLDNPDKVVKMGENARLFVEQNSNAEKYYQALMNIYQSVISEYQVKRC